MLKGNDMKTILKGKCLKWILSKYGLKGILSILSAEYLEKYWRLLSKMYEEYSLMLFYVLWNESFISYFYFGTLSVVQYY